MSITTRNHTANDLPQLTAFIARYLAAIPDAKLIYPAVYTYHPALEKGQNVFTAWDENEILVGLAPAFPVPATDAEAASEPHHIWTIVVADPARSDGDVIRETLLERVLNRARVLAERFPTPRRVRLASDLIVSQKADIDFLLGQGFSHYASMYVMIRDLTAPLLDLPLPPGVTIRHWKMETEVEQDQYLAAFNRCFPSNSKDKATLQFFMRSPLWGVGTAVSAFDADNALIASVLSYWDPDEKIGITDDVFVLPEWRGRGLARYLVNAGLVYQRDHGLERARLEVHANNPPAVAVYQATGYTSVNEEWLLGLYIR
jgi:GNAT superfamily N-acetyltransferase